MQCGEVGWVLLAQCWASAEVHWAVSMKVTRRCEASPRGRRRAGAGAEVPRPGGGWRGEAYRMRPGAAAASTRPRPDLLAPGRSISTGSVRAGLERPDRCGSSPKPPPAR